MGRTVSEAADFAVSCWMVRALVTDCGLSAAAATVDKLSPRLLGIHEHRFRSVRYFHDPSMKESAWFGEDDEVHLDMDRSLASSTGRSLCGRRSS